MKSIRGIFLLSMVGILVAFGFVVYSMFWGPERIETAGKSLPELLKDSDALPIIIVPLMLIITGLSLRPFLRILFPAQIKDGISAQAKILKVWDTGVSINDNPQVGLLIEISSAGRSPYQVETKTVVSRLKAALVQPGVTAEVRIDPQKPQRVQILTLNIENEPSASAVARMEELNALRDKGLITESEYQRKREDIIRNL